MPSKIKMADLTDQYLLVRTKGSERKLKLVLDGEYLSYQTLVMHFPQATSLLFRNNETEPYNVIRFDFEKGRFVKPLQGWPKEAIVSAETGSNSNTIGFVQLHRDLTELKKTMATKHDLEKFEKEITDMLSFRLLFPTFEQIVSLTNTSCKKIGILVDKCLMKNSKENKSKNRGGMIKNE